MANKNVPIDHIANTAASAGSRGLASGVVWNLAGNGAPLAVAVATIPGLFSGYGPASFGILSLAWATIGYFSLFDLGLSRALTQLIASKSRADRGEARLGDMVITSLALVTTAGLVLGLMLWAALPWLIGNVLQIPAALQDDARASFNLIVFAIPFITLGQGFRGVLEARMRFDVVNIVRIPMSITTFLGPWIAVQFTDELFPAIAVLVAARIISVVIYGAFSIYSEPMLRRIPKMSFNNLGPLMRFGGWMTVSNIIGPLMASLDRFFIAALISVAAVAYYTIPFDVITRLWIVPAALASVLFPAFAQIASHDPERVRGLYASGIKFTAFAICPMIFCVIAFAEGALSLWLDAETAAKSARILQILAVGVLLNSLAHTPYALIQGNGRADITAKLHLAEAPVYLIILVIAIDLFGVEGAAIAWTLRAAVDCFLLFFFARAYGGRLDNLVAGGAVYFIAFSIALMLVAAASGFAMRMLLAALSVAALTAIFWFSLLTLQERSTLNIRRR
ncbi:MAG: flippase [Pseudomonadota bacterium]